MLIPVVTNEESVVGDVEVERPVAEAGLDAIGP
jgi:hypothetical protein